MSDKMSTETACHIILGDSIAYAIIANQGVHWAVVAAMAAATKDQDPRALQALRDWVKEKWP